MLTIEIPWWQIYYVTAWAIRLTMLAVVPLRRTPQAASAWLVLIMFLPWVGLVLYLTIGRPSMPDWRKARVAHFTQAMRPVADRLRRLPAFQAPRLPLRHHSIATLTERLGRLPPWAGNAVDIHVNYAAYLASLAHDIDAARDHVHLLYYIFAHDRATEPVIAALERAAQRGVTCRVLVDALGSRSYWRRLARTLEPAGVHVRQMLPYGLLRPHRTRFDLRNHRKIAVIDGRVGYTGSQNLVDPDYSDGIVYEELVVRLEGPTVLQMQYVFAADWYLETGEVLADPRLLPATDLQGTQVAQALPSGPLFETDTTQRFIISLVYTARRRVVITTPYFVPDEPLLQALETAVLRGVEVILIVSRRVDQLLVGLAQQSYYADLLAIGIHVYRYLPRFLHAKHLTCDDEIALIGTSNMDIRSFQLNEEFSLVIYNRSTALRLRAEQERYIAYSEELTEAAWQNRKPVRRLAENLARLVSPLL